jgi:phosphoglycerate dehydrogenase-like enzyme
MPKFIHVANAEPDPRLWSDVFVAALREIGEFSIIAHGGAMDDAELAEQMREADIIITGWNAAMSPAELAANPGNIKYFCNITGELTRFIPLEVIEAGIPVTNWGTYPAFRVAEGAMTLLLAVLKDLHYQIDHVRDDGWKMDMHFRGGSLKNAEVGIYGLGVIGRQFVDLIQPFGANLRVFDPYVDELPVECRRVDSLDELFDGAQVIVIHAGLTDETKATVTAELLAKLPRHGVVINTARGGIIDQPALFAELKSGRLRAGLDVLFPDELADGHEARSWPNLILTAHRVDHGWPDFNEPPTKLNEMQEICIDNIQRFLRGDDLRFQFDKERYLRST